MSWVTEAFGSWYPTVYPHRDEREAASLVATLGRTIPFKGRRLLDVGCGAGRHLARFGEVGAHPVGLDLSPELLGEAREYRASVDGDWGLSRGDMRFLPFAPGAFDAVTSLFTSFGYFSPAEDLQVVREWARVLTPGGFHILDFLNRDRVLAHPNPESERTSGSWRILETRRVESGGPIPRIVKRVRVEPTGGGETVADYEERVTLYGLDDLLTLLEPAGFLPRETWGAYDGSGWDPAESTRLVVVSIREDR